MDVEGRSNKEAGCNMEAWVTAMVAYDGAEAVTFSRDWEHVSMVCLKLARDR